MDNENQQVELVIQVFNDIVNRDTLPDEHLMNYMTDKLVRDSDDICRLAIMIIRKLYGNDYNDFSL